MGRLEDIFGKLCSKIELIMILGILRRLISCIAFTNITPFELQDSSVQLKAFYSDDISRNV
jgi:hypothetical protein